MFSRSKNGSFPIFGNQILYSNDGGLTWAQSTTDPGYTLVDLAIASGGAFFATVNMTVGGNLIVSADGGANWNVVSDGLPENSLRDAQVEFVSSLEGWVTGFVTGANVMFHTQDGGQTWDLIFNPFRASFAIRQVGPNAAIFTGDSWLMCGNVGAIFKLGVEAVSSVGEVELPGRGNRLVSVSPNPFNPSTTIILNIPADAGVLALEIFDIRGTRICRLC